MVCNVYYMVLSFIVDYFSQAILKWSSKVTFLAIIAMPSPAHPLTPVSLSFAAQIFLITGATSGLGLETAIHYARRLDLGSEEWTFKSSLNIKSVNIIFSHLLLCWHLFLQSLNKSSKNRQPFSSFNFHLDIHNRKPSPFFRFHEPAQLWTRIIFPRMHKPPHGRDESDSCENNRIVIHGRDIDGKRIRKAKYDVKEDDKDKRDGIDGVSPFTHPEGTLREVLAAGKEMAADGESIGGGRENDKGSYEIGERGLRA
jgi:hypothetical protein